MQKRPVYVIVNNHFDPTWRRCWDRRFTFGGDTFVSYADLEDYCISDNLALARRHRGYKFEVESVVVLRKYLERHPERLAELRRLAAERRFAVSGSGDNVVDANLVLGESLVRNFVTGFLWVEEHLGVPVRCGCRNDGFGNSAQLPQILRGCEIRWATGFGYSPVKGRYWRGLDGSVICTVEPPVLASGGGWEKYPPCPRCRGKGCRACAGRGIAPGLEARLPTACDDARFGDMPLGQVRVTPEERLPNPALPAWVARQRRRYDMRFAIQEDFIPHLRPWIERVDRPPRADVHPGLELNPNNSGTWVTRIRLKQDCRRQEYALLACESLACLAALRGQRYPKAPLAGLWRTLLFTQFHDAITATHVDPAYAELRDMIAGADAGMDRVRRRALSALVRPRRGAVSVLNPFGQAATGIVDVEVAARSRGVRVTDEAGAPAVVVGCEKAGPGRLRVRFLARGVAPLSAKRFLVRPANRALPLRALRRAAIENRRFRIEADEHGIVCVHDRRLKADLLRAGGVRPNELVLEHDEGSPWATLSADRARTALAGVTRLVAAEAGPAFQRLTFDVKPPGHVGYVTGGLEARTSVTLYRGLDRVDFACDVRWDTHNHRLRVAMPLGFTGRGVYGIPYGMIERRPYEPVLGSMRWASANGDWPAVNWAGVQGRAASVALLNRGLPSYCQEKGRGGDVLWLSVLRSPCIPTYLHEPRSYTMTAFDGMRDAGEHHFEYALTAYGAPFAGSAVVADAENYNGRLLAVPGVPDLPRPPRVESDHVRLAAVKWAEQGRALVLRLVEFRGRRGVAGVVLPDGIRRVHKTNMLERRGAPAPVSNGLARVPVRPWEIATLRLEW